MSKTVFIYSSDNIVEEQFRIFLEREGIFNPGDEYFPGLVFSGKKCVWVALNTKELRSMTEGSPSLEDSIIKYLVRPPKSLIVIEIGHTPGSETLAIDFAIKALTQWHSVLCDPNDRLLGLDELRQMQKDGREFDKVEFDQ